VNILRLFSRKKSRIERIAPRNVTEAIATAMEEADRIKTIVIIYETVDEDSSEGGIITPEGITSPTLNWLLDQAKKWVLE
jgi:hypothetical protein